MGYYQNPHLSNDPVVELFPNLRLQLAVNTAQVGRTFQDRTHVFHMHRRPQSLLDDAHLLNVGVRGRRGNIQQTFPSLEYDFSPTMMDLTEDDYVHIQWEGSNSQPRNQAGEGRDQTDRNNIVSIDASNWNIPQGKVEDELETEIFTVYYAEGSDESELVRSDGHIDYHETTVQYRTETYEILPLHHVTWYDAEYYCKQYGMMMPEPRDETFNEQLRAFWTRPAVEVEQSWWEYLFGSDEEPEGEWRGDIWLGFTDELEEGVFRANSDGQQLNYTNWNPGQPDDSGYYSCLQQSDCNRAVESDALELQSQLNNAPASFHGNIVKFNRGQYYFISTRNNNFSNRAQKGRFTVIPTSTATANTSTDRIPTSIMSTSSTSISGSSTDTSTANTSTTSISTSSTTSTTSMTMTSTSDVVSSTSTSSTTTSTTLISTTSTTVSS